MRAEAGPHGEFQDSQSCRVRPYLKTNKTEEEGQSEVERSVLVSPMVLLRKVVVNYGKGLQAQRTRRPPLILTASNVRQHRPELAALF